MSQNTHKHLMFKIKSLGLKHQMFNRYIGDNEIIRKGQHCYKE
jgi:hypothetical protein